MNINHLLILIMSFEFDIQGQKEEKKQENSS